MPGPTGWPTASAPKVSAPRSWWACAWAGRRPWSWGSWPSSRRGEPTYRSTRRIPPSGSPSCSMMRVPRFSLTQADLLERLPGRATSVICLDRDRRSIEQERGENLLGGAGLQNLAYVIYTSGSTGRPKGAMINHLGLANYLSWCVKAYAVPDGVGAPVHSSISFDLTITALLAPLITGRRVDLLDDDLGVEQLSEALRRSRDYSLVKITPAHSAGSAIKWMPAMSGAGREPSLSAESN